MDKSTGPSGKYEYYTLAEITGAASPGLDLVTLGGAACRQVTVIGSGTLDTYPKHPLGTGSTTVSGPVFDGQTLPIQAKAILTSTSGITGVWVCW